MKMKKKQKKIFFNYKKKKISLDVRICSFFEKFSGLMFKRRQNAEALLFEFKNSSNIKIHSFFVFFPFVAVWIDEKGKVIGVKKVKPFRISVSVPENKNFERLIEIPLNSKYSGIVTFLVGRERFK